MRTTIELRDDQRAKLLELAARRAQKGFSALIEEAVDRYLAEEETRARTIRKARATRGKLSDQAAQDIASRVKELREHWR
jgi:predicted transcriptional regulator